jgi:hypothetical protein
LIAPNYLSTDYDRHVAANALRLTRRIAAAPALARYRPQEILPGIQYQSEEELQQAASLVGTTIFHPVGTCRMGTTDDPAAVVDNRLRVIGVDGLRVVDASVMPNITSGNTNSPTLMIAERASDMIREDRRARASRSVAEKHEGTYARRQTASQVRHRLCFTEWAPRMRRSSTDGHHPLSANPNECAASLARQWQPCCVPRHGLPSGLVQHANERQGVPPS